MVITVLSPGLKHANYCIHIYTRFTHSVAKFLNRMILLVNFRVNLILTVNFITTGLRENLTRFSKR